MKRGDYNSAVDLYADGLFRFALKQVMDRDIAQDLVQDTFMKVWEKRETIQAEKVKSYLFTTLYHLVVDWSKKPRSIQNNSLQNEAFFSKEPQPFDLEEAIEVALQKLNHIQKTVLLLRDYEGYAYSEIGEMTGLSETQVKVYIFRARQQMKAYFVHLENVV
jgi:RNA polymerase sigma-70 factor (ECF subfamily)